MNPFDAAYQGTPPWEIGRPQREFVKLLNRGLLQGRVLDLGCGTGDLVIHLAENGMDAMGVDLSGRALAMAQAKATQRHVSADFREMDALHVPRLGQVFDTVTDCGLFHQLTNAGWQAYARAVSRVLRPGGLLHVLCFSEHEPAWGGPRRVTQEQLQAVFREYWTESIREARFENRMSDDGSASWLATFSWQGEPVGTLQ
jgi:cyclopropane fatty-acyl-phospholipid synthase-like methyltransferase